MLIQRIYSFSTLIQESAEGKEKQNGRYLMNKQLHANVGIIIFIKYTSNPLASLEQPFVLVNVDVFYVCACIGASTSLISRLKMTWEVRLSSRRGKK